ncbi:MAG: prepilin-type N-terminal cleavage/methylation domain-containing protein [Cyanobacteria bacterium P01_F01_bin.86]
MNSTLRAKMMARLMKNAKGFTLIELLVVIVIVGVLSAVAVPTFLNQVRRSRVAEAQAGLDVIGTASQVFSFDEGVYPDDNADIQGIYYDGTWADQVPNYGDAPAAAGADAAGVTWTATAEAAATAYVNAAGDPLECVLGLGDQAGATTLDDGQGCNL